MLFIFFSSAKPKEFEQRGIETNKLKLTLHYFLLEIIFQTMTYFGVILKQAHSLTYDYN